MREKLKKLWIIPVICALVAGAYILYSAPEPVSKFKTSVVLRVSSVDYHQKQFADVSVGVAEKISTEAWSKIVKSTPVLLPACQSAGIIDGEYKHGDLVENNWLNEKMRKLTESISVSNIGGSDLIKIEFICDDENMARNFVNCLAKSLINYDIKLRNRPFIENQEQLEIRLEQVKRDLAETEVKMENFQVENPECIAFEEKEYANLRQELKSITERKSQLQIQIEQMKDRLLSSDNNYIDWISGEEENESLALLNKRLVELQLEKEELLIYQTLKSPEIVDLEAKISKIIGNLIKELEVNLNTLTVNQNELLEKLISAPRNEKIMRQLEREFKLKEDLYAEIYKDLEEIKLAQTEVISPISILEYAVNYEKISKDKRAVHAFMGTFSVSLIGILLVNSLFFVRKSAYLIIGWSKIFIYSAYQKSKNWLKEFAKKMFRLFAAGLEKINTMELKQEELFDIFVNPDINVLSLPKDIKRGNDGVFLLEEHDIYTIALKENEKPEIQSGELFHKKDVIWELRRILIHIAWLLRTLKAMKTYPRKKENKNILEFDLASILLQLFSNEISKRSYVNSLSPPGSVCVKWKSKQNNKFEFDYRKPPTYLEKLLKSRL